MEFVFYESQERPLAIAEFNEAINNVKRFQNKEAIDPLFEHLTDDDWKKLRDTTKEYHSWLQEELYKFQPLPLTANSKFTAASIRSKLGEFNKIVNPIMNKPKPKETKKEEVKKDETKKEEKTGGENKDTANKEEGKMEVEEPQKSDEIKMDVE